MSDSTLKLTRYAKFAWLVLSYNVLVILWGAFVRATHSGAGCGNHYPFCDGEVIPFAPSIEKFIEFFHRATSGIALLLVIALLIWAFRIAHKNYQVRRFAILSLVFILVEAALGAFLVKFELVAENPSMFRAFSGSVHLINTFILLSMLTLTAWFASGGKPLAIRGNKNVWLIVLVIFGVLAVGVSGAIAALGDTLFPSKTLAEALAADLSPTAHIFIRLRVWHPFLSVLVGIFSAVLANWFSSKNKTNLWLKRFANCVGLMVLLQLLIGFLNVILLAPIALQLTHLFLADLLWVSLVLLFANVLAEKSLK